MRIEKHITRKSMLYKTGVEYGDYTMNFVQGCSHGCRYPCYAYMIKKRFGQIRDYDEWIKPAIVSNTLDLLDKEIPRLKNKIKSVHLCFATDPFMYGYPEIEKLALESINKLNEADIKCVVLTKGILPKELLNMSTINEYGISIISLSEKYRNSFEPGTASYDSRIKTLRRFHKHGLRTWVSIEPYPTPNILKQDIDPILERIGFVDKIVFGRTNYCKTVSQYKDCKIFYNETSRKVIDFCKRNNIEYHIKNKTISE